MLMIRRKKQLCIVFLLLLFMFGISFLYEEKIDKEFNQTSYQENVELAIYLNDEETNSIPSKDSGYYYDREKSTCSNGAYINWDSVSWSPVVNNMSEYKTRCELHFTTTYTEGILNGADPVLKDKLVPITIENDGTVKKADLESEWYSYANKNWANAVILEDQYESLNTQGKVQGATKQDGYVSLDGVDDYIDLGLENYDFKNSFTISIFISLLSDVSQEFLANVEKAGISMYFSDSEFKVQFYNEQTNQYEILSWNTTDWNQFHILSATYDGFTFKMYADGNLVAQKEIQGNVKTSSMPFLLGANPQPDGSKLYYSNSNVKQLIIYNRALSEEEIKESASSEIKVVDDTGLLRYVDFTNKSYEENEIIPEEAIESYFVWIPKYRYQLWDLGQYDSLTAVDESKVHEIPIIFGDYTTLDEREGECTTPMGSGETGICQVGDYMTHPAFLSIPSTGFWIGKFETGTTLADNYNVRNGDAIRIKPNVSSWRGIQVANAFYTSYDYKRDIDSHMMKNIEWGAVAYLQHSTYGSATSVRINNNSSYITGYQANDEPTCGWTGTNEECNRYCNDETCNTPYPNSTFASITGNISGIYDMSGGSFEYVMGIMLDQNGDLMSGRNSLYNSGFNGTFGCPTCDNDTSGLIELTAGYDWPDKKYYDTYAYATVDEQFQRRILGDATGEMGTFSSVTYLTKTRKIGSWYSDQSHFLLPEEPWFVRGMAHTDGLYAGDFSFVNTYGHIDSRVSFRIILTPTGGAA